MKYFIIAGEKSGDLHGSNLIKGLIAADSDAVIECWGGELMEQAGGKLLKHYSDMAFMGYMAVIHNLGSIFRNMALCRKQIAAFSPDVVILIDFPGFNFRIAEYASSLGIKVFYYISPKIWAWKEYRVKKIRKYVNRMFIIFPFETEFFKKHGMEVEYYGNPLVDEIDKWRKSSPGNDEIRASLGLDERPVITLLAGSRRDEVRHILPPMLQAAKGFKNYQFVLAAVSNIPKDLYSTITAGSDIKIITGKTYELLAVSEAALVKSGTSTLEAAIIGTPEVVCYSGDPVSFAIVKRLVNVKFISLVNLIMDREVVRELIQDENNPERIAQELSLILKGGAGRERMLNDYSKLNEILGPAGASDRIALEMVRTLKTN